MLNETIKKARLYSCLTQAQMADLLDISKSNYLRKENGAAKLSRSEVVKISHILRLDESQLLTFWMADNIHDITKNDSDLVKDALALLEEHIDDYETCVIMPKKSDSFSSITERMTRRHHKNF